MGCREDKIKVPEGKDLLGGRERKEEKETMTMMIRWVLLSAVMALN